MLERLIRERNRELDLAHYSMTAAERKRHREKANQLNEKIRCHIRQEEENGGKREI